MRSSRRCSGSDTRPNAKPAVCHARQLVAAP